MRIKKLAIIHPVMTYRGGAEQGIRWVSENLHKRGVDCTVYTNSTEKDERPYLKQVQTPVNLNVFSWNKTACFLSKELPKYDAILIENFPAGILWNKARELMQKRNIKMPKTLWHVRDHRSRLYGNNFEEYKEMQKKLSFKLDFITQKTIEYDINASKEIDIVCGNSNRVSRHCEKIYERPFKTLYPALPEYKLSETPVREKENYFVFIGRIYEHKNPLNALYAFKNFISKEKNKSFRLKFLGEGPFLLKLKKITKEIGMENFVDFEGYVNNNEIGEYFQKALGIFNISFSEAFGLISLEAWANYAPLILSNDAGSSEIAENNVDAYIVDPKSVSDIENALRQISSDKEKAFKSALRGNEKLRKRHLISHHVDEFLSLYE